MIDSDLIGIDLHRDFLIHEMRGHRIGVGVQANSELPVDTGVDQKPGIVGIAGQGLELGFFLFEKVIGLLPG